MSNESSAPPSGSVSPAGQAEDTNNEAFDIESITRLARNTIVLHPGSSHLRLGRASDPHPILIPHVIAWRHKRPGAQTAIRKSLLSRDIHEYDDNQKALQSEGLKEIENAVCSYTGRPVCRWEQVAKANKKLKSETLREGCGWTWTDTSKEQPYLIGDDALYIDEKDCYDLHWPFVKGQLNVYNGPHGSLSAVLSNLEILWTSAIEMFLNISRRDLKDYRCLLLVPDIYIHQHVREMVHMLINRMGFSSILVHQESVCATYGCGTATACVVDVGHEKTSVCCIEDGISHRNTRVTIDMGGRDVTRAFAGLLKRNCLPYQKFNQDDRMDALLMEELKETFCHMEPDRVSPENQEFHIRRPHQTSLLYPIVLGDETLQAPMSLFFPKVLGLKMSNFAHVHYSMRNPGDSEDPLDEYYLHQTRSKNWEARAYRKSKNEAQVSSTTNTFADESMERLDEENGEEIDEDDSLPAPSSLPNIKNVSGSVIPNGPIGLHQAIVWSIENCPASYEDELKRRMYSCILVVGGGLAHFPGADVFLAQCVKNSIPPTPFQPLMVSQVDVVVKPKDQDPSTVAWKGGSVLSCLDNAQECWITGREWSKFGSKLLRERCPFVW